jgi:hypothetical protein
MGNSLGSLTPVEQTSNRRDRSCALGKIGRRPQTRSIRNGDRLQIEISSGLLEFSGRNNLESAITACGGFGVLTALLMSLNTSRSMIWP